ncbi:hypothetical protein [Microbulbifer litoralis]|uniref:hypothetical protein n=1 Tax=Microbulbifer litoralis TaxID=2933965 RepID=UPI0020279320|nr:hypothetical protein [Microbulbifer sp. GX H0434]
MFRKILIGILVLAISLNLLFLSLGDLTSREVGLLSTLLAILSIAGSWIVAHIYAEKSNEKAITEVKELHQSNLRTYALNAAEKVNNVSIQLNRLAGYLQDALNIDLDGSPKDISTYRIERISSAVHILHTLRSVNDTTLNDWRGVIDEELEEQKEERESREAEVQALIDRVQTLESHWKEGANDIDDRVNREELDSLRKEVRTLVREITGSSLSTRRTSTGRTSANCPSCGYENSYGQYQVKDNIREIRCSGCGIELVSTFTKKDKKTILEVPKLVIEDLDCPGCGSVFQQELSTAHRSKSDHRCRNCGSLVRVKRNSDRIRIRIISQKLPISEEILEQVKSQMPPQPWPTGIHKEVQANLGITPKTYQRAIDELISRGIFKKQVDGVLYEPGDEIPQPA